jgi:hypothetical protein
MSKRTMWSPEEDAMLRALPTPVTLDMRVALVESMRAAGYDRTARAVQGRLYHLGLSLPPRAAATWTPAEDATLRQVLDSGCDDIVAAMAAAGVVRSAKAIGARINRLPDPVAPVAPLPVDRRSRTARDFDLINTVLARVFSGQEVSA